MSGINQWSLYVIRHQRLLQHLNYWLHCVPVVLRTSSMLPMHSQSCITQVWRKPLEWFVVLLAMFVSLFYIIQCAVTTNYDRRFLVYQDMQDIMFLSKFISGNLARLQWLSLDIVSTTVFLIVGNTVKRNISGNITVFKYFYNDVP